MKVIPNRTFLLKQVEGKDVIARKGEAIDISSDEYKRFAADVTPLEKQEAGPLSTKKK